MSMLEAVGWAELRSPTLRHVQNVGLRSSAQPTAQPTDGASSFSSLQPLAPGDGREGSGFPRRGVHATWHEAAVPRLQTKPLCLFTPSTKSYGTGGGPPSARPFPPPPPWAAHSPPVRRLEPDTLRIS